MLDIKLKDNKIGEKKEEPVVILDEEVVAVSDKQTEEKDTAKATEARRERQKKIRKIVMILFGTAVFFLLTTLYLSYEVYVLRKLASSGKVVNEDGVMTPAQIMEAVSYHMLLPGGVPQIATVQDAEKLRTSQTFFKDATNGDVVLVYDTMIILYRPSTDLIIAVGDINGVER